MERKRIQRDWAENCARDERVASPRHGSIDTIDCGLSFDGSHSLAALESQRGASGEYSTLNFYTTALGRSVSTRPNPWDPTFGTVHLPPHVSVVSHLRPSHRCATTNHSRGGFDERGAHAEDVLFQDRVKES